MYKALRYNNMVLPSCLKEVSVGVTLRLVSMKLLLFDPWSQIRALTSRPTAANFEMQECT